MILNLDLYHSFEVDGAEDLPQLEPYIGALPPEFVAYGDRKRYPAACGIHFFTDDYRFHPTWTRPEETVLRLMENTGPVIVPDYSLFVGSCRSVNVSQLFRNRWTGAYWQHRGLPVIPSASWGDVGSFDYCFDGLSEGGVIAISHVKVGKDWAFKELYRLGVKELVRRKKPALLAVYGAPLDFDPSVEVRYIEGFIQKRFRKR